MASPSTSDLSGNFKDVFGDKLKDLIPQNLSLTPRIGFEVKEKLGNKFRQPVVVQTEQGVTYGKSGAGAFDLEDPVALITKEASVDATNLVLSSSLDYESAARAASSKQAFAEVVGLKVKHLTFTARKRLEIGAWYGQTGLGILSAVADGGTNKAVFTVAAAGFAPLVWAGMAGAKLDLLVDGAIINTNGPMTVTKVDIANKQVYVDVLAADDAAVVGATITGSNDYLAFHTAFDGSEWQEMLGIHGQLSTSGPVFGIDNSVYDLWAPGAYAAGGAAMTFAKVLKAVGVAVARGLDEDAEVFVSYDTFGNLASDMAALRHIDQSYDPKKGVLGNESIEFHGLNGKIRITPSGFVWGGYAYVLPLKDITRVGATDITFSTPGSKDEDIFFQLDRKAGFGFRCYSHQGIADLAPAKSVIISGIVNS